jgi:phage tail sheath gpL-like
MAAADDAAGVLATGTVTVVGTATAAGTICPYVAGQRLTIGVLVGDTATVVAAAIAAAITAAADLPVTAAAALGVVTLTCKWKGATGNDITLVDRHCAELQRRHVKRWCNKPRADAGNCCHGG